MKACRARAFTFSIKILWRVTYAICDDCGLTEFLGTGKHNSLDNGPRTVQGKDVNRRVVYAASEMGIGTLSFRPDPKMQMSL